MNTPIEYKLIKALFIRDRSKLWIAMGPLTEHEQLIDRVVREVQP